METRCLSCGSVLRFFFVAYLLATYLTASAADFTANLAASPNPNTGDFTLTFSYVADDPEDIYAIQEKPEGGSWTQIATTMGTSLGVSGRPVGTHQYRIKWTDLWCRWRWGEWICSSPTVKYSEEISVVVESAGGSQAGDPGDPYPDPGPFTPPDDADFPDAPVISPADPGGDSNVGALNGSGGVSGGQASYSIPIVVPPGRKGMQPAVSLGYSSSAGYGLVGVGWGLNAHSTISRCSATAAQDDYTAAVQYDAARDRLCLDGQRLMVTSGTYGAGGAQYRTELDSFARVTQTGAINGTSTSFLVEYKNGMRAWFGTNSDARHSASGRSEILTWALSETRDRSGNSVTYDYDDLGDGEYVLDAIHYTGYNGTDGDRHVRFVYEPNLVPRSFYVAGGKTRLTQRLKAIKTEYQSTLVRQYNLVYKESDYSDRDLLDSVEECAYEGGTPHCLRTTDFEWHEAAQGFETSRLYFWQGSSKLEVHGSDEELHLFLPRGDIDGDGVKDWDTHRVNAEGQITGSHTVSFNNCFKPANSFKLTCLDVDLNADGITDGIRRNGSTLEIALDVNEAGGPTWLSTGITWGSNPGGDALSDSPLGFADFNGDGWVDLAMKTGGQLWIYFHTQSLAAPLSSTSKHPVALHTYGTQGYNHTTDVQLYGDMDGNGSPDFVVSNVPGANATPGLPTPDHIILIESQSDGTLTTSTRNIPSYQSSQSAGLATNANFFHDINGDGLQDLVSVLENTVQLQFKANTGTGFDASWTNLGFSIPYRQVQFELVAGENAVAAYPIMSKMLVMDYDGNGKDEMLVAEPDVLASSCTKIAQAQGPAVWKCDDELYETYQAQAYAAVEAPINGSSLDNSVRQYRAYRFDEDASGNITHFTYLTDIVASASQTAVVDVTGDGLPDVVTAFGCRNDPACQFNGDPYQTGEPWQGQYTNSAYADTGAWINRNRGTSLQAATGEFDYAPYDLMSAAEDGLGNRHEWTYKPLSSDAYDTGSSEYYHTVHDYQLTDPDYFHFASSMYVVAEHQGSNGIGGLNSTKYRYRGAIYNNKGRGFQGFRAIEVEEDIYADGHALAGTDKIARTEFHQKWPTSSIVEVSCSWLATDYIPDATLYNDDPNPTCEDVTAPQNNKQLSHTVTDTIHDVATLGGARFVAVKKQTAKSYDLDSRSLLTTKVTDRTFDSYGNVTFESQSHTDDWTTNLSETTRTFYTHDTANWWINKVWTEDVTHHPVSLRHGLTPQVAVAQDLIKTVTKTFDSWDTGHRLPSSITITGNDTALSQTVTTFYNGYGLPTDIETTGTDVTGPRTVKTTYSKNGTVQATDGYFPFTVENALTHISTMHVDPTHGQPTSQWDPNGLLAVTSYDAFGRVADTTGPGQPIVMQRFFWCDGYPVCPAGAEYMVNTVTAGAPAAEVYFDQFGREIQTSVETFDGTSWVNTVRTYDERGNVTFESAPYDLTAGESNLIGTRYLAFDAFGRLTAKEVDQTESQVLATTYTHAGFTTTINAGGISMSRTFNGLGQLVETTDGEGNFTRYAYDGAGNPIVIADPEMIAHQTVVGIKAAYNSLGHKEWVEDPDWWDNVNSTWGQKTFTYSALGEVLSETDPNGNLVEMLYDELGRLIQRKVNGELNGKWYFDSTDTYGGLGLLWLEDSQFRGDGSRLQKFYYYSDAATGRKDLLQVMHRFYENDDENDFSDYPTAYFTDGFYARPKGLRYPGGTSLAFDYNNRGHVTHEKDPVTGTIYRNVTNRDSRSNILAADVGNHEGFYRYQVSRDYFPETGQADYVNLSSSGASLQNLDYRYDVFGNLEWRSTTVGSGATEDLYYDDLQRLVTSTRSYTAGGSDTVTYEFDMAGTFKTKSDYIATGTDVSATYVKDASRPHVVTQLNLSNGGVVQYAHDENGNVTVSDGETVAYNAFNKPIRFDEIGGNNFAAFVYGADLMRYKQTTVSGSTIYYLDKLMEIESAGTAVDFRHYLGDVAILTKTGDLNDPDPGINYIFRDRLGSVSVIGDPTGLMVEYRAYDAYGRPRNGDWTDRVPPEINSNVTDRGFTDHEHLDDWQLIHMNGRGFDYNSGRFTSIDPIIQSPGNSQNLNGYVYVLNNPLSGKDPTGYCSTSDSVAECGSKVESGKTQKIRDENGKAVGVVGKDAEGNLYFTNNGKSDGSNAIRSAIRQSNKSRRVDAIGSMGEIAKSSRVSHGLHSNRDDNRNTGSSAPTNVRGRVILSFDDGPADDTGDPNNPALHSILGTLKEYGIIAEFYLRGGEAKAHPNDSRAIADSGHVVQNHGWEHPLTGIDEWPFEEVEQDIRRAQEMILIRTGKEPTRFRPPTGAGGYRSNPDPEIYSVAENLGLVVTNWDIDSRDAYSMGGQAFIRIDHVTSELNRLTGRQNIILLLHVKKNTARDLSKLIDSIYDAGFGFSDPTEEYEWP